MEPFLIYIDRSIYDYFTFHKLNLKDYLVFGYLVGSVNSSVWTDQRNLIPLRIEIETFLKKELESKSIQFDVFPGILAGDWIATAFMEDILNEK
jgi:hypothetical protein